MSCICCLIFCGTGKHLLKKEAVVVVIVWLFDLQLPVQSMSITTKVVSSNLVHGEVYSIQHYDMYILSQIYCNQQLIIVFYIFLESYTHYISNISPNHKTNISSLGLLYEGHLSIKGNVA
jgi:hypothetical protein